MTEKMKGFIEKVTVDAATFHEEPIDLTYINFFFGKNGSGKSTIAKAMKDPETLTWQNGVNSDNYTVLVYNQDFIDSNFETYGDLKGVFTLSEENAEIRKEIDEKTAERDAITEEGKQVAQDRDKKSDELAPLLNKFQTSCWDDTEDVRKAFDETQKGKKRKAQFAEEALSGKYAAVHHEIKEIQKLYDVAYDPDAKEYSLFKKSSDLSGRYDLSGIDLLEKSITSSSETDFSKFMKALNATDWVKNGHAAYVGHSKKKCPFCQQKLPDDFEKNIADCFDEQYQNDLLALDALQSAYSSKMEQLLALYNANLTDAYPKADTKDYEKKVAQLESAITSNLQQISDKVDSPAKIVSLKDTDALIAEIDGLVDSINEQIQTNNDIVSTKHDKQLECSKMVWEEIAYILQDDVKAYEKSKKEIEEAVKSLNKQVKTLQEKFKELRTTIADLNSKIINTKSTVDSINAHLTDSGFEGFHLQEKEGVKGTYEVIRENGKVAEDLSEGERNFIAFLYFYHVVKRSLSEVDTGKDKIVVIDDPVSSMDSSALFIVSALVREMLAVCSNNVKLDDPDEYEGKYIKQMLILTHNAFFHREISYNMERHYRYVTFFKITKKNNISSVDPCIHEAKSLSEKDRNYNPVQNSYTALWEEYNTLDAPIPLMNVMRRILEYYFLQLCRYDGEHLCDVVLKKNKDKFISTAADGKPAYVKYNLAKSMLRYIKSSESYNDGIYFTDESIDADQYREVLRMIFDLMDQRQHYDMMMNETE